MKLILPFLFLIANFLPGRPSVVEWISPKNHDFGDIVRKKPVAFDFEFRNLTDTPLIIDNVRTSCGCTASDWEESPTLPGEIGKIHIVFDAQRVGFFYKKIKVFFNGQRKGEMLSIEGYVEE